jgi:endonuclease/exonuclease/phosphatase family metal-dependent hydrolase
MIEAVARNLSAEPPSRITRSLHPTIHKTAREKPEGLFVDFIFGSKHFTVKSIDAPVVEVSDHLPIRAILEI